MKTIELIVPCYNEEKCISKFYDRVREVFSDMPECTFIITFVDDGSNDNTITSERKIDNPFFIFLFILISLIYLIT